MSTGVRSVSWRADAPATLVWAEAQDGGDPRKKVAVHDSVFALAAPFSAAPTKLIDLDQRYRGIEWGKGDFALLTSRWWQTRNQKLIAIDPSKPGSGRVILERNYQDRYNDPGQALTRRNAEGEDVLHFTPDGKAVFVAGAGASAKGELSNGRTDVQLTTSLPMRIVKHRLNLLIGSSWELRDTR